MGRYIMKDFVSDTQISIVNFHLIVVIVLSVFTQSVTASRYNITTSSVTLNLTYLVKRRLKCRRNKMSSCENSISTSSGSTSNQAWDRLSLEMAVQIYDYLPMQDKFNLSLTCKSWLAAFRHPGTWRYSQFVYTGNRSANRHVPHEVLSSLQYVTIDCNVPRYIRPFEKILRLQSFILRLQTITTLQRLDIMDMKALGQMISEQLTNDIIQLIAKQTTLARLSVLNARVNVENAFHLLTAAGQHNAHCLKYLNVINFCELTSPLDDQMFFAAIFGRFTNLTELSLACGFLSDDILRNLSGTLKRIAVYVYWNDLEFFSMQQSYTNQGWYALVSKCTGLKAEYHVDDYMGYMDRSPYLVFVPEVPLANFLWCSRGGDPNVILQSLEQIINTFKNGLEHLHLDFGFNILSKRDVAAVVESCPLLQTFFIEGKSAPEVENMLAQRHNVNN